MRIVLSEADRLRLSVPLCGVVTEVVKTVKIARGWPTPEPRETPDLQICRVGKAKRAHASFLSRRDPAWAARAACAPGNGSARLCPPYGSCAAPCCGLRSASRRSS